MIGSNALGSLGLRSVMLYPFNLKKIMIKGKYIHFNGLTNVCMNVLFNSGENSSGYINADCWKKSSVSCNLVILSRFFISGPYDCEFEGGLCHWTLCDGGKPYPSWHRWTGPTKSSGTGPLSDHTSNSGGGHGQPYRQPCINFASLFRFKVKLYPRALLYGRTSFLLYL